MPIGAHHSPENGTDEWLTPPELIQWLGPFDLDPCAPIARLWDTARRHCTIMDNGLIQRWEGRVWLNPPYSDPLLTRFIARMAEHGRGTALVFSRTETDWFFRYVWPRASALLFVQGRINFYLPDGNQAPHNSGGPSVLIAYGLEDADRLAECQQIDGHFQPLSCVGQIVAVMRPATTWPELCKKIILRQGGSISLDLAYVVLQDHPKARANQHWRAKIRQTYQGSGYRRTARGQYEIEGLR